MREAYTFCVEQRRFVERHAARWTPFSASLPEIYQQAERSGCRQTIDPAT